MGNPATVQFAYPGGEPSAKVYLHWEGDRIEELVSEFIEAVKRQAPDDTLFDDAEYLAARFVVWYCREENRITNLNFTGIGITRYDDGVIVRVDCEGTPIVRRL
jgi:hypothetical protein